MQIQAKNGRFYEIVMETVLITEIWNRVMNFGTVSCYLLLSTVH